MNLLKNEKVYSGIRLGYIVAVILYSLARQNITALQPYLMGDILNLAVIGIAAVLVLWDVVFFRNIWKTKYIRILAAFGVLTVISSVAGFRYGYIENVKAIANLFIQFCLLYVVGIRKSQTDIKKEIRVIGNGVGIAWFIASAISVFMYFADISYTQNRYLWGETSEIVQGFVHEHFGVVVMRLWGIFVDPNFASAICIAVICLSLFVIFNSHNKAEKIFHIVNIVIQYLYVVLSNSRMGLLILCLASFAGAWYYAFLLMGKKKLHALVKEVISIGLAVVFAGLCYASVELTKTVLPYVRYAIEVVVPENEPVTEPDATSENASDEGTTDEASTGEQTTGEQTTGENTTTEEEPSTQKDEGKKPTVENLERQDVVVKSDVSNGRFDLWKEGLVTVFKGNMIFGVGPRNYHAVAKEVDPTTRISTGYSIHNSFVELLMGNGITGTLVMLLFLVLCAKDAIKARYKKPESAKSAGILMVGVLSLLACGMFIACLFYTLSGATVIVFMLLGYSVRLCADIKAD